MVLRRIYKLPLRDFITSGNQESLVTNGFGSYFADAPLTSYQGWYQLRTKNWRVQKILESLTVLDEGEQTALYQQFYGLRRLFKSGAQDVIIPYRKALLYQTIQLSGRVLATFDHRESYEGSSMGRHYKISEDNQSVIIRFTKENEYEEFVVIKGVSEVEIKNAWKEKYYEVDAKRSGQGTGWVFDACTFIPDNKVVFATGATENEARTLADIAYHHFEEIVSNTHEHVFNQLPNPEHVVHPQLFAAGTCAAWSLQSLHQQFFFEKNGFSGVYAGLPWFFQVWSRDELISLKGLMQIAKVNEDDVLFGKIKNILERHLKSVDAYGRLANRFPHAELGSSDALGWLAKRILDFISVLKEEKQLYNYFSIPELIDWSERLKEALKKVNSHLV
ncbi:hypothetical protein K9M74_05045, partial [Candidatus Woesearchaeota archaeon]|nr:hypothetical protein [Candidatus Woesearchaeota archaeon]